MNLNTFISVMPFDGQSSSLRNQELIDGNILSTLLSMSTVIDSSKRCLS